ncbi:MAG TPA: hypothetical protein VK824_09140 [Planctomycetota bacterium]|nr:hypothetical protein [Planctomycetota bacterium]
MTSIDEPRENAPAVGALRPGSSAPMRPGSPSSRKGVFEPRSVRFISFVIIALGLFVTAVFCILAIWDYATRDTAWRALATLGVVAGTMLVFTFINEMFGARLES